MGEHESGGTLEKLKKNIVFISALVISLVIVVWCLASGSSFLSLADNAFAGLMSTFDWLYIFGMSFFVIFAIVIAISPLGKTKMGDDDDKPTQSTLAWFAMLFSAGMGVGLVFWGVAEPLSHYVAPIAGIDPLTEEAARFSLRSCFMHWGFHPWGCYAIVGMSLGYFLYRKHKSSLISSTLEPVLGKQSRGAIGIIVDVYAAILTVMGVAASFGMGCLQISSGLDHLFGIPSQVYTWAVVIGITCIVYTWSVVSGIERGMQMLSNTTMILCAVLLVLVLIVGPQIEIVRAFMGGVGDWLTHFIQDSFMMEAQGDKSWIQGWRVFYWAWWISWSPFVGIFLARISRGRSIRGFVLGTMVAPTIMGIIWFSIFGGAAFNAAQGLPADQLATIAGTPETAPFIVFSQYNLAIVLSVIALVLLFCFFVTSANSATYVLSMLTSFGDTNPPVSKKVFWGILVALVSFAFTVSGGVSGIQTFTIVASFPFFFIMVLMCISLVMSLVKEKRAPLGESELQPADNIPLESGEA